MREEEEGTGMQPETGGMAEEMDSLHRRICQGGWGGGSPPSFEKIRAKCPKIRANFFMGFFIFRKENLMFSGTGKKIRAKFLMAFFLEKKNFFLKIRAKNF